MWYASRRLRAVSLIAVVLFVGVRSAAAQTSAEKHEIATALGRFAIGTVDVGDRFPPGCGQPPGPDCEKPDPGSQFVVVWLEPRDNDDLATKIRNADILGISAHVALVTGDGARTDRFSLGMREGRLFVAFATKTGAKAVTLSWPGNPDVPLGR